MGDPDFDVCADHSEKTVTDGVSPHTCQADSNQSLPGGEALKALWQSSQTCGVMSWVVDPQPRYQQFSLVLLSAVFVKPQHSALVTGQQTDPGSGSGGAAGFGSSQQQSDTGFGSGGGMVGSGQQQDAGIGAGDSGFGSGQRTDAGFGSGAGGAAGGIGGMMSGLVSNHLSH